MKRFHQMALLFVFLAGTAGLLSGPPTAAFSASLSDSEPAPEVIRNLPFSPARRAGNLIFLSGQIPMKPDGTLEQGSTADQTRQTMENLRKVLADHGCSFDDVVQVTVYLKSMDDYAEMNSMYRTFFSGPFPARECVGGLEIAFGSDLEISAVAFCPEQNP